MNVTSARQAFAAALEDALAPAELAEFGRALQQHPELDREFEHFASDDASQQLLALANLRPPRAEPLYLRIRAATSAPIIPLNRSVIWVPIVAAAAALAVALLLVLTRPGESSQEPVPGTGDPAPALKLVFSDNATVESGPSPYLLDGTLTAEVPAGQNVQIDLPDCTLRASGPASFQIIATAETAAGLGEHLDRSTILRDYGASRVLVKLSVSRGQVNVIERGTPSTVAAGESLEYSASEPEARLQKRFDRLDASRNSRLEEGEAPPTVIRLMAQSGEKSVKFSGFRRQVMGLGKSGQNNHEHEHEGGNDDDEDDDDDDDDNEDGDHDD